MSRIPESIIDQIQQAADLVESVSAHVPLKRAGRYFKGLCPFHQEKTPSFHVDPVKHFYHCFGCGAGGTIFTWVMKQEGVTFPEAVRKLAERAGIRVPDDDFRGDDPGAGEREAIQAVNRWAMERFEEFLRQEVGNPAKTYLKGRGVEGVTAARFHLGYAPPAGGLVKVAERDRVALEDLQKAGLVGRREEGDSRLFEMFRGRVIFPILDAREQVVGFGGRTLGDAEPKYLNTAQNAVFQKGKLLYALPWARKGLGTRRQALVVEGYMDCLMAHQFGIDWTVATLGTALTEDHARILGRQVDRVVLLFDPDAAGVRAALRSLTVFARVGVELRIAMLPGDLDPCEFLTAEGRDRFQAVLDAAEGVVAFRLRMAQGVGEWDATEGRSRVVRELVDWAAASPDAIRREMILKEIAERSGLSEAFVRQEAERGAGRSSSSVRFSEEARRGSARPAHREKGEKVQRDLLRLLLEPSFANRVAAELLPDDFKGGRFEPLGAACLRGASEGAPAPSSLAAHAENEEEAKAWAEVLAVDVNIEDQEACERWIADSLRWIREERKRKSLAESRPRFQKGDPTDPALDEALRNHLELIRKDA